MKQERASLQRLGGVPISQEHDLVGDVVLHLLSNVVQRVEHVAHSQLAHLADLLQAAMQPDGLAIVMEADHFCMQWRGVKDADSKMINSVMRGAFLSNASLRREFLALLKPRG